MRNHTLTPDDPHLQATRRLVSDRIRQVLEEGNRRGEIDDPNPALTTQFILGFVRGALLYPPDDLSPELLGNHMLRIIRHGIQKAGAA
jgi:AcrR family transcriptional regulator